MSQIFRSNSILVLPDGRLDTANAAAYVGLSIKTLAMMRCRGEGPRFIKRGKVFYYLDALDEWLRDGEVKSTAQMPLK